MDNNTRFSYLLQCFQSGSATAAELEELEMLFKNPASRDQITEDPSLLDRWNRIDPDDKILDDKTGRRILSDILSTATPVVAFNSSKKKNQIKTFTAAAAAVLLIVAASWLLWPDGTAPAPAVSIVEPVIPQVIVPGTNKAELILGDGSAVSLDSTLNGQIAAQGNVLVQNIDGRIVYTGNTGIDKPVPVTYNTLRTPKGGFYQLTLSDGTRLWLNAASSLRFPVSFATTDRTVHLDGEAYFEVAKDAKRPFRVLVNGMHVEVLGTHFDIMAYANEGAVRTTLLEGSVKVKAENKEAMLVPGQQAKYHQGNQFEILNGVNTEEVVAWKNGYFQFERVGLEVLMREIERWYDVEVVYEGLVQPRAFGGKIARSSNIRDVLRILELSKVQFRIENKKIIVSSKT